MKKPVCKWQRIMLDTEVNGHFIWCACPESKYSYDTTIEERCLTCPNRAPAEEGGVVDSIAETIDVELDERPDEEIQRIIDTHCKKCDQYIENGDICQSVTCGCRTVVRDTIKSLHAHCPDGVW